MKATTFVLLFAILLAACAPAPAPTVPAPTNTPIPPTATVPPPTSTPAPPTPTTAPMVKELDDMLQKLTADKAFSGAVLIAQNGQIVLSQGYGFADRDKQTANTPQTKFRIASMTKQFTAMAILILQKQGKLTVQDKLCTHLADCPDTWKAVTIHQLLTHTSGVADPASCTKPADKAIEDSKASPLTSAPGERFGYSAVGYLLLGKIIEAASGQSYEAFLQKNIFEPLQMANTGYDHGQLDIAIGYLDRSSPAKESCGPQSLYSVGALYSTAEDLYRWDQALSTEQLVPRTALDTMFTAHSTDPDWPPYAWGYGWYIQSGKHPYVMHGGELPGYASVIRHYLDDKTAVIILTNQEDDAPWDLADKLVRPLWGD